MVTYRKRGTFLQGLHPISTMILILTYMVSFIVIDNPVYMGLIFLSLISMAVVDGCIKELIKYGAIIVPFVLFMIILNPLIVKNGNTVIYQGKINIPVLGPMRISLEAIAYGLLSGVRILCVTMAFGLGNLIIHPDRSFSFLSKYIKNSALLMSMTLNLFPRLARSYGEISDIEKLRGNHMDNKKMRDKIKSQGNIINILFLSSLEDSVEIAESMYSRGYGIGKKSVYFCERLGLYDKIYIVTSVIIFAFMIILCKLNLNGIEFYPKIENPLVGISYVGIAICLLFYIPSLINWRCIKWKY